MSICLSSVKFIIERIVLESKEKITLILIFNYGKKKKNKIQNNGLLKVDSLAKNWSNMRIG